MDILILLLLFVLYVVPEIFRRTRKPKKYEYPQFPTEAPEKPARLEREVARQVVPTIAVAPMPKAVPERVSAASTFIEPPQEHPIALEGWAYGFVMTQILNPPKCLENRRHR